MRIPTAGALLLLATSTLGQVISPAIPLTNTRYSTAGEPAVTALASNGQTIVAAWSTPAGIRVSSIGKSTATIGLPLGGPGGDIPALAAHGQNYVLGWSSGFRVLDRNGSPSGPPVSIGVPTPRSRIASTGS